MQCFVHSLTQALEPHLDRHTVSAQVLNFNGLLILESCEMYDPSFLCLGEPDIIAQIMRNQHAGQAEGCLISAGDSHSLRQTACPFGMSLLVTDLPLLSLNNLINRWLGQIDKLHAQLTAISPYNIQTLLATASRITKGSFLLLDSNFSITHHKNAASDCSILDAFVRNPQKNTETIIHLLQLPHLPEHATLSQSVKYQTIFVPMGSAGNMLCIGPVSSHFLASAALIVSSLIKPLIIGRRRPAPLQSLSFQLLFSRILTENGDSDDLLMDMLQKLSSPPGPYMRLILVRSQFFFDGIEDTSLDSLLPAIRAFFPKEHIAVTSKDIVILLSSHVLYCPITFSIPEFEKVLDKIHATAMIANPFTSIMAMRVMFRQCQRMFPIALSVRLDNENLCFTFARYTQYNVIDICASAIPNILGGSDVVILCHPSVLVITRYDRAHGTNLRDIMFHYLMNDRSITLTSSQLFMHRNTTINKIKKIEELIGESMDDPYLRHNLIFSCLLLRYRERYQKEGVLLSPFHPAEK